MNFKVIGTSIAGFLLALLLSFGIWYHFALQPADSTEGGTINFSITRGQSVDEIANALKDKGLIANPFAFSLYATLHGDRSKMQTGTFALAPNMSVPKIIQMIVDGDVVTKRLVIPEGSTVAQIKELAVKQGIDSAAFDQALLAAHTNAFLANKPDSVDLEGYLFPDSYELTPETTADKLVQTMLDTFGKRVTSDYESAFRAQGLSLHEGLTLASIVEKEVAHDRDKVAQVFFTRLRSGQALQSDVTVDYAAKRLGVGFSTTLNSVYNTYMHKGLPPGPICNPGLDALNAVAHPANTKYVYFLADKQGNTHFAHTFAEHQANIAKYLK